MNWQGLLVGLAVFAMVGVCHPMVVWMEYNIGRRVWKLLLVVGVFLLVPSLFASGVVASVLGGASAAVIYSAVEVVRQHKRAVLGRAARNPRRPASYYELAKKDPISKKQKNTSE